MLDGQTVRWLCMDFFFSYLWHFFYIHTMGEMQLFSLIRLVSFLGVKVAKYRHILIFFASGVVGVTADHHVLPQFCISCNGKKSIVADTTTREKGKFGNMAVHGNTVPRKSRVLLNAELRVTFVRQVVSVICAFCRHKVLTRQILRNHVFLYIFSSPQSKLLSSFHSQGTERVSKKHTQ